MDKTLYDRLSPAGHALGMNSNQATQAGPSLRAPEPPVVLPMLLNDANNMGLQLFDCANRIERAVDRLSGGAPETMAGNKDNPPRGDTIVDGLAVHIAALAHVESMLRRLANRLEAVV